MTNYQVTFFGSILKAIACTPNKNFDHLAYEQGVIEPTKKIRKLAEQAGNERPSEEQIMEIMVLLWTIFETKQVDLEERSARIKEIVGLHSLQASLPEQLASVSYKG
jgi:[acyl-carrier-protein] S-malonyltransferase